MAARLLARWPRVLLLLHARGDSAEAATAEAAGGGWTYDRTCRAPDGRGDRAARAAGAPRAVRFKVPDGETAFDDLVHGPIAFDNANIEDFVILRSDGQPTYHLSVVVDDVDMAITHVVRGDDHISNTPKQVLLYQRVRQAAPPQFAHVPLILGPDKKRLSKRHGATSVMEYQRHGYLPEAMVNFLALLGWSPGDDQEVFTRDELVARVHARGDQRRQRRLQSGEARLVQPAAHRAAAAATSSPADSSRCCATPACGMTPSRRTSATWLLRVIDLLKPRCEKLGQFVDDGRAVLRRDDVDYDSAAVEEASAPAEHGGASRGVARSAMETRPAVRRAADSNRRCGPCAEARGIKAGGADSRDPRRRDRHAP